MSDRRRVMAGQSFRETADKETVTVVAQCTDDYNPPVTKSGSFLATKVKIVIKTQNMYDGANITITTQNGTNNISLSRLNPLNQTSNGDYQFEYSTTEDNPYISYQITARGYLQWSSWAQEYFGYSTTITLYSNEE